MNDRYDIDGFPVDGNSKEMEEWVAIKIQAILEEFELLRKTLNETNKELNQINRNIKLYNANVDHVGVRVDDLINILKKLGN